MSNVGLWEPWYSNVRDRASYANTATYKLGAEWLKDCEQIEDWGCGMGWLREFVPPERYRGIDGSASRFNDEIVDLVDYRSEVPGIFMRHVLEHNLEWKRILDNALASFTDRMALILFTPLGERTRDLDWEDPPGVPNLSFAKRDLTKRIELAGVSHMSRSIPGPVKFGGPETLFKLWR